MSSPNHSTSDIEDAFFFYEYSVTKLSFSSIISSYHQERSFNSSENSTDNIIPPVFSSFYNNPRLKDVQAFYAKELPISPPDPITSPAILTPSLQVEDILNYLVEIYLHRIERMEERRINGNKLKTELKRIRTQIIKLQKKKLGKKDKIAFAQYRISNLEQIIKEIQARHQTDQEDL
ncbi:hypothetical protein Tco_1287470 [Tanacetum coccineum]